jgi:hypothetical protein
MGGAVGARSADLQSLIAFELERRLSRVNGAQPDWTLVSNPAKAG